jgi:hypothetical protein
VVAITCSRMSLLYKNMNSRNRPTKFHIIAGR